MKNTGPLQFTEHHRFFVYREFLLSPLDRRMLTEVYQPMIGHGALAFYQTLYQQIEGERIGYSAGEQQRSLFYTMGIELNEQGRRLFIQYSSQLEALGLLQTVRRCLPKRDEWIYVYQLIVPLSPRVFFMHAQYPFLLRDCIGQHAYHSLQAKWKMETPVLLLDPSATQENVTVQFEERFRVTDEDTQSNGAGVRMIMDGPPQTAAMNNINAHVFSLQDLLMRTPKTSARRSIIQRLEHQPDVLSSINYIALKHQLSLANLCRILDEEDGVFDVQGRFFYDQLDRAAREWRQHQTQREEQVSKHVGKIAKTNAALGGTGQDHAEEPRIVEPEVLSLVTRLGVPVMLTGKLTIAEYASKMQGLPFTQFIKLFLGDQPIPQRILALLERVNYYYRIHDDVINVLTHFMYTNGLPWNETFVEKTTNEWLMSRMTDFSDAVLFFERKTNQLRSNMDKQNGQAGSATSGRETRDRATATAATRPSGNKKPTTNARPQMNVAPSEADPAISAEKLEEIRNKARAYEVERKKEGG